MLGVYKGLGLKKGFKDLLLYFMLLTCFSDIFLIL